MEFYGFYLALAFNTIKDIYLSLGIHDYMYTKYKCICYVLCTCRVGQNCPIKFRERFSLYDKLWGADEYHITIVISVFW